MPSGRVLSRILQCVLSAGALFVSATAAAQESGDDPLQFSITPFAGYTIGGGFKFNGTGSNDAGQNISLTQHGSFALAADMRADQDSEYEVFYSRQSTGLTAPLGSNLPTFQTIVEYLHFGGNVVLDNESWIKPYFGAALGVTRLSPSLAPGREDTHFSLSLALGLHAPISEHFALRVETRGFFTPIGTETTLFCRSNQSPLCDVRVHGSSFSQGDVLAGATFAF